MKDRYPTLIRLSTLVLAALALSAVTMSARAAGVDTMPATAAATTTAEAVVPGLAASRPSASQPATTQAVGAFGNQDWHKDPNIRILGFTPYQFLYLCIGALVVINALAFVLIAIGVVRARRENAGLARNPMDKPS